MPVRFSTRAAAEAFLADPACAHKPVSYHAAARKFLAENPAPKVAAPAPAPAAVAEPPKKKAAPKKTAAKKKAPAKKKAKK